MRKRFTILIAALMLLTMVSQPTRLWGQTRGTSNYTITFGTGSGDGTSASTSTACSTIVSAGSSYLSGNLVTATKVYYNGSNGLKLGTSSAAGVLKMNLSTAGQAYVTSVVVNAQLYNSGKDATLKVNGSSTQSVSSDFSDLTFVFDGNTSFTYLELNSSKYIWVKTITVNYTTYNVTYNANDANATGSTVDSDSPYKKGASVTVMDCGFEVAGKTFDGWYTNSSYTGTKYVSGDTYTNSISDDVTFYAKWTSSSSPTLSVEPEEAETFTYSHGKGASASQAFEVTLANSSEDITVSVESDDDVFEISDDDENFDVEDLTLSSDDIFTVRLKAGLDIGEYVGTVTISSTDADDVTIDLSGTVTGYTVTYKHGDGGTGDDYVDNNGGSGYGYHTDVTVLGNGSGGGKPNFSKTGFSFVKWNTKENGSGDYYDPKEGDEIEDIEDNVTLHAQWTINSYDYTLTTTGVTSHVSDVALKKLVNENWVALSVGDKINYNTPLKIFATPASGYVCSYSVTCGESPVSIDENQEFTMPDGDIEVTVNVSERYNITIASPISNGSVSVVGNVTSAAPGTTISLTATPSSGYRLVSWDVYKTGDESTTITVTNNQFTMPSYDVTVNATFDQCVVLPYSWAGGGSSALNAVVGVTVSGAGTDYGNDHNPCNIKFDGTGDYILIKTNSRPGKVTVKVKMVGGNNTSKITIQESSNGDSFSDVADLTISGDQNDVLDLYTTNEFASTSRYVKFLFTKGSNVGVGPITIAKYSTDPEINAGDTDIACDALSGSIEFTITRPVVDGELTAEITDGNEGSWLSLTSGTYITEVPFTCSANATDSDRSAIVTLTYTYNTSETVTKNVTVTQGKCDFAMLTSDFTYDGNGTGTLPVGLTQSGLGTYSESPKMSFNDTGDFLILKLGEAPVAISYDIKGNSFSGGTYKVQVSVDGSSYEDLATYTSLGSSKKTVKHICGNSSVRFIKWVYTTKSSGNVALGNIIVSKSGATITDNTTLSATNTMTVGAGATLTFTGTLSCTNPAWLVVNDGGQLISNNSVSATMLKNSATATNWTTESNGWSFIASPVTSDLTTDDIEGLVAATASEYDLYYLNEDNSKWYNYKAGTGNQDPGFKIKHNKGYLYASKNATTINFVGNIQHYVAEGVSVPVTKSGDGWNLIGNPFTFNAYADCSYYKMNSSGTAIESVDKGAETIAPCTGIVVKADAAGSVKFTKEAPESSTGNQGNLQMTLSQQATNRGNTSVLDNVIVSFNEGSELEKFYFGNPNASLYIPQGNEEYAIVSSNGQGEMPVNFRAYEAGEYTITVNPEEVEMGYLHLIDNIAGKDVDLIANPSYTFNARTDDYESRFRLVFSTTMVNAEMGEDFAFMSDGQLVIANEGEATLQVIDVTGRVVATENINGTCSKAINAKAGVYVLRLVNGTDVKTQKMVIR